MTRTRIGSMSCLPSVVSTDPDKRYSPVVGSVQVKVEIDPGESTVPIKLNDPVIRFC